MAPTIADLFASPDWYLHSFDGDDAVFVAMDRAAYRASIFLDYRIAPAAAEAFRVPMAELLPYVSEPQPLQWIFHVAHCGSTLLARALEALDPARLVLREPLALRQVALDCDPGRLRLVLAMLGKRWPGDGPTLVKANVPVNFVLPELAATAPAAPAILLYLDLPDYCAAILRSEHHRAWLSTVTVRLADHLRPFDPASDGERAAALWLAQIERFAVALSAMSSARSLDGERFYANRHEALNGAAHLFGLDGSAIDATCDGPLFRNYSKRPGMAFDNAARVAARDTARALATDEIGRARAWLGDRGERSLETLRQRAL